MSTLLKFGVPPSSTPIDASEKSPSSLPPFPPLGLGSAWIGEEEEALVLEVVRSKNLFRYAYALPPEKQGIMCATLEREMTELLGVKYALAVTSGTAALEVALAALGVGPGDEVIVPAWSWISCFTSVVRLGALPVLAEIDETFCLAPGEIRRLASPRTKAAIVVHYQGVSAEMNPLLEETKEVGIALLEDCAESPGALYHGRRVGSIGDIGILSFQAQKTMTCGEGGLVVTNQASLYERAVRLHDLGQVRGKHARILSPSGSTFSGGQYRMNELSGAVALAQLRKLDSIRACCRNLKARIMKRIGALPGLEFRRIPDPSGDSGFEIYFLLPDEKLAGEFNRRLHARNVHVTKMTGTYCHYAREYCQKGATHTLSASPFKDLPEMPAPGYRPEDFPKTESLVYRFVALPLGVQFTEADADHIASSVEEVHHELLGRGK